MRLLQHSMNNNRAVTFFMVYNCNLLRYNLEYTEVYFKGRNRRLLSIEVFEENYCLDEVDLLLKTLFGPS